MQNDDKTQNYQTLDLTGHKCPWLLAETKKKMLELSDQDKLLVITTDPSFKLDLGVYLRQTGYNLDDTWQDGDKLYSLLRKTSDVH